MVVPLRSKSVTLSMYIDVVENIREFDRINWPLTLEMFTFFEYAWICLQWSCLKAVNVSVPMFVFGGLWGSTTTSALVIFIILSPPPPPCSVIVNNLYSQSHCPSLTCSLSVSLLPSLLLGDEEQSPPAKASPRSRSPASVSSLLQTSPESSENPSPVPASYHLSHRPHTTASRRKNRHSHREKTRKTSNQPGRLCHPTRPEVLSPNTSLYPSYFTLPLQSADQFRPNSSPITFLASVGNVSHAQPLPALLQVTPRWPNSPPPSAAPTRAPVSVIADVARPQECNAENSTPCTEDIDSPMSEGSVDDHLFIAEKADETNTLATYQPYS